ncbi:hypothetical protein [Tenacibaculum halocynthiae]|uniref:hypothetical protein n=1 Tax=Tenacibaculum halocynthiae TaxID=1254437 RepID=UPI003D649528
MKKNYFNCSITLFIIDSIDIKPKLIELISDFCNSINSTFYEEVLSSEILEKENSYFEIYIDIRKIVYNQEQGILTLVKVETLIRNLRNKFPILKSNIFYLDPWLNKP